MHNVYNTPGKCNQNISNETGKTKSWENKMNLYFGSFFFLVSLNVHKRKFIQLFSGVQKILILVLIHQVLNSSEIQGSLVGPIYWSKVFQIYA